MITKLLSSILILSFLSCKSQQANVSYTSKLEKASTMIKANKQLSDDELLELIPTTEKEYLEFYSLTDPNRQKEWEIFNQLNTLFESKLSKNKTILKNYLEMSRFVDGEFAESYFEVINYYVQEQNDNFCEAFKSLSEDKRKRIEFYFEESCE